MSKRAAPVVFLVSIPIAFVQPTLAPLVWWLLPFLGVIAALSARRRASFPRKTR